MDGQKDGITVNKWLIELLFGTVVVGLLSWNVYTTQTMTVQQAVVGERVLALQASLANTVTKTDLDSRLLVMQGEISRLNQIATSHGTRISNAESRLNSGPTDTRPQAPATLE